MSLILWTGADAKALKDVVAPVIQRNEITTKVVDKLGHLPHVEPGDVILACGAKTLGILAEMGLTPKGRTVTSMRGKEIVHNGISIFSTFDPTITYRDYARFSEIQWDVQLAIRLHNTGTTKPKIGTYRWVESFHEVIARVVQKHAETGKPVEIACDLETLSLNPYDPENWIVSISFSVDEGFSDVMYFEKHEAPVKSAVPWVTENQTYWEDLWDQINWLLTTPTVSLRGANWKYDSTWTNLKWGINCTNFKFDTMLVGSLLDENRSNSLKLHAKIMTPLGGYEDGMDKYDKARMDLVPKDDLLQYAGGDTDATLQVARVEKAELLQDRRLANFYTKLLHPSSKVFEKMERTGMLVDVPYYHKLQTEVEAEIARIQEEMLLILPNKMRIKHKDSIDKALKEGKSPFKPSILKEFLFTPSGLNLKPQVWTEGSYEPGGKKLKPMDQREPSTAMDHLMMFETDPIATKFIAHFSELGAAGKTLSTYIKGFLKHLRPDNRFHATYLLAKMEYDGKEESGTDTGRTSAKDPAVQTIPKHTIWTKRLRRAYIAPPGYVILQCVHPDTKIWMADLTWKRAADLTIGEELFAFDEEAVASKHRKMRTAIVEGLVLQKANRLKLVFEDGASVTCADHHKWLSFRGSQNIWRETKKLKVGDRIRRVTKVHAPDRSFEAGWLSGIFDGEGWLSGRHGDGWGLGIGQKEGVTLDSIRAGLIARGHEFKESTNGQGVKCLRLCDTFDVFRFLQEVRPERLVAKRTWEGYALPRMGTVGASTYQSKIVAIYPAGFDAVVSIKTSTGTYVAEGLASHNCDYSQGELRICAVVAGEPTMIKAYGSGADLHAITAAKLNGYTMDEFLLLPDDQRDALRSGGKAGNFGLIYGMSAGGYKEYAFASYKVSLTANEAENQRDAFFDLYSRLPVWHEEYKNHAHMWGHVRSPLGRVRHLPLINSKDRDIVAQAERQAINSPIQSCLSDMMQLAMVHIDREYGHCDIHPFLMCHDSLALYVPENEAIEWAKKLKYVMENLPLSRDFGWDSCLKFIVDAEVGLNLAELKKIKGL